MAIQTFAAIDVGSFELELGIYEVSPKYGICRIDHIHHVIALGKDTYSFGKISYKLVEEMCRVLEDFSEIMKGYHVINYRAYATSALREAKNSQIVLEQIRVRTGIEVFIISNSEQRLISYKAVASKDIEFNRIIQKGTAIVDVGYGSMQISLFDKDALISTQNLMLGILRIRSMLSHIQTDRESLNGIISELVDNEMLAFRKMYLKERNITNLIGIGDCLLYLSRHINGGNVAGKISAEAYNTFYDRLLSLTQDQIQEIFEVNADYASLLRPCAIIYKQILELTGAEMFWIPGIRLCDGIAAEYAEDMKLIKFSHDFSEDILAASRNMAKRYKCHTAHIQIMEKHVLSIFDCTKKYHGLGKRERLLLQISAILHSCGNFISMKNTGDCAYNIIMGTEIIGLSHLERAVIANVVFYNIREFDYNAVQLDGEFLRNAGEGVSQTEMSILIAKLTAILRLANSMDRSQRQKLADCKMAVKEEGLVVSTGYEGDITVEALDFERKADFFEEIFGVRPVLKHKRRVL